MNTRLPPLPLDLLACPLEGATLVEASAGTGKTWNICGLYLRLLLERDFDVREILVVTFTNAATAELRTTDPRPHRRDARATRATAWPTRRDDFVRRARRRSVESRRRPHARRHRGAAFDSRSTASTRPRSSRFTGSRAARSPTRRSPSGLPFAVELLTDDSAILQDVVNDFWRRRRRRRTTAIRRLRRS